MVETLQASDIVHQKDAHGTAIVRRRQSAKSFLARGIPLKIHSHTDVLSADDFVIVHAFIVLHVDIVLQ